MPDDPGRAPAGTPSDDELLVSARRGDPVALEALLVRYQPHLYRFGLRMCGNADDASDVVQESLISMARSLRDFRGDASVSTWLYTIARRFCIKKRRRRKFAPVQEESLDAPDNHAALRIADPAPGPEEAANNREVETALSRAIAALDGPQREVLVLRDVEGLSAPEVAKVLDIRVEAVKSRLHRARVAVRGQLAPVLGLVTAAPPATPPCPDIATLFSRHLEGDLDPTVCATLEAHLEHCASCRATCDALKRILALCRQSPSPRVPESLAASVRAGIRAFLHRR